ncbi:UPF0716 protein FxsA [Meinhardsimonia xiamenensis]|jgi:UPF0716 protein FxsA|uniref:UPF0716 protein FxsA n=1 Tax=Meinhardsimonia xiamenensis TaxID=990712 RepID=A0A1G8Y4I1_9RHOB|nr:FxsA family protein [Meinhardsimonia xiamenensis]PRX37164.1 UPF0716 protein FxsA [Meinhardsimonia xiamenensis]SDJ97759.1 UPF0716 protein FxsA [Meinhardsimonia xiamenensis]
MWLFAIFLAVPLVEIALFITVGGAIGLWPTLAIVVLTALVGTWLVRSQGLQTLRALRGALDRLDDPTRPLGHGAMILFAGALLVTPGFFTDTVGFLLLVPGIREALFRVIVSHARVEAFSAHVAASPGQPKGEVIDGDYEEVGPEAPRRPTHRPARPPSGWTRH